MRDDGKDWDVDFTARVIFCTRFVLESLITWFRNKVGQAAKKERQIRCSK